MSKISSLIGKSQTFKIGDIELEFKPLKFDNMNLIADLDDESKRVATMKEIVKITLKEAVPDITDKEISEIAFGHIVEITKAIQKVNGLEDVTVPKKD